ARVGGGYHYSARYGGAAGVGGGAGGRAHDATALEAPPWQGSRLGRPPPHPPRGRGRRPPPPPPPRECPHPPRPPHTAGPAPPRARAAPTATSAPAPRPRRAKVCSPTRRYEASLRLHKCWIWFLVLGIVLILLGIAAMGAEVVTTLTTVLVFGILLLAGGVV